MDCCLNYSAQFGQIIEVYPEVFPLFLRPRTPFAVGDQPKGST